MKAKPNPADKFQPTHHHSGVSISPDEGLHFLVVTGYQAHSGKLLQQAQKMAAVTGASVQALYVETPHRLTIAEEMQLNENISMAKQLAIPFRIVTSFDVVKAIVNFSLKENITHIFIEKIPVSGWFASLRQALFLKKLIRYSGKTDVYIMGTASKISEKYRVKALVPSFTSRFSQYLTTGGVIVAASVICYFLEDYIGYQLVPFCLLFLVSILAIFYGTGPILLAALMSALILDFFFFPPLFTFHIGSLEDIFMFLIFLTIALLNGILTSRVRRQEVKIRIREERTHALYQLTRDLSLVSGIEEVRTIAVRFIRKYFQLDCTIMLKADQDQQGRASVIQPEPETGNEDFAIALWVFEHSAKAGKHTGNFTGSQHTFYPLKGNSGNVGVIAVKQLREFTQGEEQFWDTSLSQISGKFEREYLRETARKAFMLSESDKLYKTLFNSISHELRIPVATILGASDTLLSQNYPQEIRKKLYTEISVASLRLNRLIENLLNMSRLESGNIHLRYEWNDLHDLVNKVQEMLGQELRNYALTIDIPPDMPLVKIDFGLMEQVLYNLLLNAVQYSPPGSPVEVTAHYSEGTLILRVSDRGKGFPGEEAASVFDKFYRGKDARAGGTGLGLSIVKGFAEAHRGTVSARNRENGGAEFIIKIPCEIADIK